MRVADVADAEPTTKMTPLNLAIVITLTLLHHPHDPRQDAQLANPHQNGGAALLVIHLITHYEEIFPPRTPQNNKELPLPPPPTPPRSLSTPPTTPRSAQAKTPVTPPKDKGPKRFLIEDHAHYKSPSVRLIPDRERRASSASAEDQESSPLRAPPTTSLSTPDPIAEFGVTGAPARGKGRVLTPAGSGVVEELRRVYEERCRIVKTQEPRRKEGPFKASTNRGGMGVGIGRVS